ncbi:MAG: FkbM family methyltransferase [Candidatus Thorarchaeota archaeon]
MSFNTPIRKIIKFMLRLINLPKINYHIRDLIKKTYSFTPWRFKSFLRTKHFYSSFIKKGDLCFDIGANRGQYTKIFLQLGARVVSVEPQIECLKMLYKLYSQNKLVKIVGKAVGSHEGVKEMIICNKHNSLSTLSEKWKNESRHSIKFNEIRKQKVELITLDKLIERFGLPQFCKIDVEGYELKVLKGLSKRIPILCFEFVKEFLLETQKCIERILSIGPAKFNFTVSYNSEFYFKKWVNETQLFETLVSIDNHRLWGDIYIKYG